MRAPYFLRNILLLLLLPLLQNCGEPKATVFEDNRLSQEEEVKLCFLGDLGRQTEMQEFMAKSLQKENCHRIFFLGDLVYPKGIKSSGDTQLEDKFLKYYRPLVEADPNLYINLILGNHDHQEDPAAWKDVAKENPGFFFPHYYYMIDYGGLCIVALDTSFYYYPRLVAEATAQTSWLNRMQNRIKNCDVKVAATHHPFKGTGYQGSKDWEGSSGALKTFLDTYVVGTFDIHIAGHVHALADDGKDEGTKLLISGTGGENLSDSRAGYVVLTWQPSNPKRVGYTLRRLDTEVVVDDESSTIQEQEADDVVEYMINKRWVEAPWWARILSLLGIDVNRFL
jgi:predicted phosphodiesterase